MKIHLVDGTFELFRAYFSAPEAKGAEGQEVGATRGFIRGLLALLSEPDVTHVACAFDHVVESFRNRLFDGYKTGAGLEPELLGQFPLVERAAAAMGTVVWPMVDFEADDGIATAAHRFADDPRVEQVVICSPDKDMAQCVRNQKVVLWDRIRKKVYDESAVAEKWGIPPKSMPDWLALVGDSADGIPGVPKWGAKSASTLLRAYGHVEKIPSNESHWFVKVRGAKGLGESLRGHQEEVRLYKTLATLRTDAPLPETLDDLEWKGPTPDLTDFLERIDYARFLHRVEQAMAIPF